MKIKRYFISDQTIAWSIGNKISDESSAVILTLYRIIKDKKIMEELNILDVVPSYNAIALHFDPWQANIEIIIEKIDTIIKEKILNADILKLKKMIQGKKIIIPVSYNGEDLKRVADYNKMTEKQVIKIHTKAKYRVAMVGFLPHFPYLIGLDKKIETPRLNNPRIKVPKGSVAIGGVQTGIYPKESPGGWNLIGTTDPSLLIDIKPGDEIEFQNVS